ncbi:MAG: hypothetical protein WA001_05305 [Patescibacteria group bacterium]
MTPEREDFYQHYPNLLPEPDDTHSITHGERVRFQVFLKAIAVARNAAWRGWDGPAESFAAHESAASWRAVYEFYRKTYRLDPAEYETHCAWFAASVKDAHACIRRTIQECFTEPHRLRLLMTSDVESEQDPFELLRLCCMPGADILSRRTRFEARRQLTLAQLYFEMRLHGDAPDDLDRDMAEFDHELKRHFFVPGKSDSFRIVAELNPEDLFRVKSHDVSRNENVPDGHSTEERLVLYPDVRFFRVARGHIPVYYEMRVKADAPLKLLRKNQRDTRSLTDLLGAKFVFFCEQDLLDGVDLMRRKLVCVPGTVFGEASNISHAGVLDSANTSSASEFRAWKYNVSLFGRFFELQFMLAPDWINERCSRGRENHALYKLDTNCTKLFPKLFPAPFYLDWDDAELREQLHRLQLARIWS